MHVKSLAFVLSLIMGSISAHAGTGTINLNQADVKQLTGSIKGIGKTRAQAIVAYRDQHSGIKSIDELAQVKGVGKKFVEKNREQLTQKFSIQ